MSDVWNRVQAMEGETLLTSSRNKKFRITSVDTQRVYFIPDEGKGTLRSESRETIEHLAGVTSLRLDLRPTRVQEQYPGTRNSSYLVAILQKILSFYKDIFQ